MQKNHAIETDHGSTMHLITCPHIRLRWGLGKASNEAGTKQTEETCYEHGVVGIQVW